MPLGPSGRVCSESWPALGKWASSINFAFQTWPSAPVGCFSNYKSCVLTHKPLEGCDLTLDPGLIVPFTTSWLLPI